MTTTPVVQLLLKGRPTILIIFARAPCILLYDPFQTYCLHHGFYIFSVRFGRRHYILPGVQCPVVGVPKEISRVSIWVNMSCYTLLCQLFSASFLAKYSWSPISRGTVCDVWSSSKCFVVFYNTQLLFGDVNIFCLFDWRGMIYEEITRAMDV